MNNRIVLLVILFGLAAAGCAVGPDYQRPETAPVMEWQNRDTMIVLDSASLAAADTGWWEMFGDTVMTDLIHTALRNNNDVRIAAARVEEFMGYYGVAKSDFWPKIGASANATRGQLLTNGDGSSVRPTSNRFDVNLNATWEIDLWGKIRRASEAAKADLLAAEESRRGVVLSVTALVASSYIDLLSLDKQLGIARLTLKSRQASLELFNQRKAKGDVSELELSQIESQYWLAAAQVPFLEAETTRLENAINVLVGRNPGPIPRGIRLDSLAVPGVPDGVPSEVLERRPDVRQSEEQLRAANARIGVAKSFYFPSISLTGLFGMVSTDLTKLFRPESRVWSVGADVFQPIFRGGEISAQVAAAEAVQKEALYSYVSSVQNAFRDVEDALVTRSRTEQQTTALAKQVEALRTYERLARMRYREGVTSYLEVLDAERTLFSTELEYAQTQANLYKSVVGVYRAVAGGWADRAALEAVQPDDPVEQRPTEK